MKIKSGKILEGNYYEVQATSSSEPVQTGGGVELGRSHSLIVYLTFRGDISLGQMGGQKVGMQAAPACLRYTKVWFSAEQCPGVPGVPGTQVDRQ